MQQRASLTLQEGHMVHGADRARCQDPGTPEIADAPIRPLLLQTVGAGCIAQPWSIEAIRKASTGGHELTRPRIGSSDGVRQ
jgi:hypothetical protein